MSTAQSTAQSTKQIFREIADGIVVLWWKFFDWLAIVPWKTLVGVCVLVMITGAILGAPQVSIFFILGSLIIKAVATGKHSADVAASQAQQRAEKEQLERTAAEAHLEALQAQIEPHFLFNTLASIDQLILTDPPRASRMQQSLIKYLRAAMPQMRASGNGARPTLGQQVELSRAFLEIMAVRMDERLQTAVSVPEGLRSAIFPSMMLQTLVENAIRHGLEPRAEGGRVEIRAEIVDGMLAVQVCDTGAGFNANNQGGVGLANIRERLKVMYRDRAELVISVPAEGGTCATIRLPYEVAPAAT